MARGSATARYEARDAARAPGAAEETAAEAEEETAAEAGMTEMVAGAEAAAAAQTRAETRAEAGGRGDEDDDGLGDVDENGNIVQEEEEEEQQQEVHDEEGARGASAGGTRGSPATGAGVRYPGGAAGLVGARAVGLARRHMKLVSSAVSSRTEEELVRARAAVLERLSSEDDTPEPTNADLVNALRQHVKTQVNARGGALVGAIREKLDQPGRAVPRRVFETLLALGKLALDVDEEEEIGYDSDDHGDCINHEQRWLERSNGYITSMQPAGRQWLELAMSTSVLGPDADLSFAFEVDLDPELEHQIDMDLPRTYPDIEYFDDPAVLLSMRRVLRATAVAIPEVGYVQGMNFLIGYLMLHAKTDHDALRLAVELMANPRYNMRNVFVEGLPSLRKLTTVLQGVVRSRDPQLYKHFCDIGFEDMFFVYQWICTLFGGAFPFDALEEAWTLFYERGWVAVVAIVITLMTDHRRALLRSDFEHAFAQMKVAAANPKEGFVERARNLRFPPAQIQEIEQAVL